VTDYLAEKQDLKSLYTFSPSKEGIAQAVRERQQFPLDRKALVSTLQRQYEHLSVHEKVTANIQLLGDEHTFTVCTAHQPNLLTGYLYFIYKIIHAIKLAEELQKEHTAKNFVPVYYMGSEDNDLEELGTFRYGDRKFVWDAAGQTGAVGRMQTKSLKPLLEELFSIMGPPGAHYDELKETITEAYIKHKTIGAATQYLVNELFGRYGLVVIDPDDRELKRAFIPVMKDDVLHATAFGIVTEQAKILGEHYKVQAAPRQINLFYLTDNVRERIEKQGDSWVVLNTEIRFTEAELLVEIDNYPERFSPNVILRGLFQETILPDVAFIGGGAEVAYWLQLRTLFSHYNVFYPNIQLRQSVLWINATDAKKRERSELNIEELFLAEVDLLKRYVTSHSQHDLQTGEEQKAMEAIMEQLKQKAANIDSTLRASAEASLAKIKHQFDVLEKKMLRAEKKKMQVQLARISSVKAALFPSNGLQERIENFISYYLEYGPEYLDVLKDAMQPFRQEFLVIENN
jgi:bacillithiol biosynthesis cysteine-adding enzyme BshC